MIRTDLELDRVAILEELGRYFGVDWSSFTMIGPEADPEPTDGDVPEDGDAPDELGEEPADDDVGEPSDIEPEGDD